MNIFATDISPRKSAEDLDNKRVIKMILECAQMLCTALHQNGGSAYAKYKTTHINHPSNVWARTTRSNYEWLLDHMKALCSEYTRRYNKKHNCESMLTDLTFGARYIPAGPLTPFANCAARKDMGLDFKHVADVHLAYKLYLIRRWASDSKIPTWPNLPNWFKSYLQLGITFGKITR